ncbi:MAG: hypothetical protein U1E61_10315 [Bradyrhizobium sp.]
MPLLRYFIFVGATLVALLLIADWYLPPLSTDPERNSADRSIIRIHSQQRWPAAVVFDTTVPTVTPSAPAAVAAAEASVGKPAREAFAMAAEQVPAARTEPVKPAKPRPRQARTRTSGNRVASSDAFGFRNDLFVPRDLRSSNW